MTGPHPIQQRVALTFRHRIGGPADAVEHHRFVAAENATVEHAGRDAREVEFGFVRRVIPERILVEDRLTVEHQNVRRAVAAAVLRGQARALEADLQIMLTAVSAVARTDR